MLKKISYFLLLLITTSLLASCVREKVEPPTKPSINIPDTNVPSVTPTEDDKTEPDIVDPDGITFTVKLVSNGKAVKPAANEDIRVIFDSLDGTMKDSRVDTNGIARVTGLDGDFFVHLNKSPEGYAYFPNDATHYVTNDFRELELELHRTTKPRRGSGTDLYDAFITNNTGYYSANVAKNKIVYFDFLPPKPGTYYFESLVDCYNDDINPIANVHMGTFAMKPKRPTKVVDDGGFALPGGYTRNFKLKFTVSEDQMGNIYTFGVRVESKNEIYPNRVDFLVLHADEYENNEIPHGTPTVAQDLERARIKESMAGKKLYNADFGTGSYFNTGITNGTGMLDGSYYRFNEEKGIYYLYDPKTNEPLAPLVAYINKPTPFYPIEPDKDGATGALTEIQAAGNTALTVVDANGNKLDYSDFIEKQYNSICNPDGCTYVTKELKDFLQMFTNRNKLFMDGNGWIENFGVYAKGEDQWLFACAFYWDGPLPF